LATVSGLLFKNYYLKVGKLPVNISCGYFISAFYIRVKLTNKTLNLLFKAGDHFHDFIQRWFYEWNFLSPGHRNPLRAFSTKLMELLLPGERQSTRMKCMQENWNQPTTYTIRCSHRRQDTLSLAP
jgi:hypothetical protein